MTKVAQAGEYTLTIEQMKPGVWWWSVKCGLEIIARNGSYGKHGTTERQAMEKAEAAYLRHRHRKNLPQWITQ